MKCRRCECVADTLACVHEQSTMWAACQGRTMSEHLGGCIQPLQLAMTRALATHSTASLHLTPKASLCVIICHHGDHFGSVQMLTFAFRLASLFALPSFAQQPPSMSDARSFWGPSPAQTLRSVLAWRSTKGNWWPALLSACATSLER